MGGDCVRKPGNKPIGGWGRGFQSYFHAASSVDGLPSRRTRRLHVVLSATESDEGGRSLGSKQEHLIS